MIPDVIGRPAEEAEAMLRKAAIPFVTELTRPTKDFFPVDKAKLYVVRAVTCPDDSCRLTLAAKQRKEV